MSSTIKTSIKAPPPGATVGGFVSTAGFNGLSNTFSNSAYISSNSIADAKITIDGGPNGKMKVDVPLLVNGRDVMREIDEIRDVLLLLRRDVDMESKYPKLKQLADEYRLALEKYKTFELIKDSA